MKCKVLDCNLLVECKELCSKHYYRLKRHGRLDLPTVEDKFWEKVDKKGPDECWLWTGGGNRYGQIKTNNMSISAHRFSYMLKNGNLSKSLLVCHKCDTPKCVNPAHLFLGSAKENTQDMVDKGRSAKGESHGNGKLTETIVLSMRKQHAEGQTMSAIARQFGVSVAQVSNIINRKQWTHLAA